MQPEKCSCSHGTSSWPIKTFPIPPLTAAGQKDGIPSPYRRNTVLHLSVNAPSTELRSELAVLVSGSDFSPVGRQLAYCHQLISPRCQLRNQHHCRICCRTVDIMHQYDVPILTWLSTVSMVLCAFLCCQSLVSMDHIMAGIPMEPSTLRDAASIYPPGGA